MAYQIGDVVSVMDYSGGVYYAIIRGLLVDQYAMKYAVLTWVLPKRPHPVEFDPVNFILGKYKIIIITCMSFLLRTVNNHFVIALNCGELELIVTF